jgi:superfamily II DNA/RNA helicase
MEPLPESWESLSSSLDQAIIKTVHEDLGFDKIMPVQKTVIPLLAKNYDVTVESCTGSGKTLAFVLPLVNTLIQSQTDSNGIYSQNQIWPKAVIISPTRELAVQIHGVLQKISEGIKKRDIGEVLPISLIGGKHKLSSNTNEFSTEEWNEERKKKFLGSVWVGTPGRLREEIYQSDSNGKKIFYKINKSRM